ncbi:MAG: hypothetical protein ACR2PS_16680 [Pseudomonadales bacterium]
MMLRKLAARICMGAMFCVCNSLLAAAGPSGEAVLPTAAATQQRTIKHNPFERPDFTTARNQTAIEEQQPEPQKLLQLRAVLYSSTTPLVNINGRILAVGEEIDGFLLQEVSEDGAILVKDEVQIMLSMAQE